MEAMLLREPGKPLELAQIADPEPADDEVVIDVSACGVCRTDLHIVDGELPEPKLPLVLGHQIVGTVVACGSKAARQQGERVGVPWLGSTCGSCSYCTSGRENLCSQAVFTGYLRDGGYAQRAAARSAYCLPLPEEPDDAHCAPLLCAGLIGLRALSMAGTAQRVGLYGFGASAHIVAQILRGQRREFCAFTRPGDEASVEFARKLGAAWAGSAADTPPHELDAAIIFAPAGELVVQALGCLAKGGTVVCAGIHMSDIPSFPYAKLWGERSIRSVANLTREDGHRFFELARQIPIRTSVREYPLRGANAALADLRAGQIDGAAVLRIRQD